MTGSVALQVDGSIGWVVFDHRQRRNAITFDMWQSIPGAVAELEATDDVRVIVLRGAGDEAFVSGADISEFERARVGAAAVEYQAAHDAALGALANATLPTVAMIHGPCLGGGLAIALSADLRFADPVARFTIPAAKLGIGYSVDGVGQLARIVGPSAAKHILFTGALFDAEHALRWGLVNDVVASEELEAHVRDVAAVIASNAPLSVRAAKLAVDGVDVDAAEAAVAACADSDDYREGIRAFMAKRPPVFVGR